ncbi:hypothetical protein [Gordonia sp. FQ]|uniref:hypothetical protein n=1 Tax=Gordonia sp. FQ TaxID=3446634 RepID=UPI003F8484C0
MSAKLIAILYVIGMIVLVAGVDVLFLRGRADLWPRLAVNIAIVAVAAVIYVVFLRP